MLESIQTVYHAGGWLGLAAYLVMLLVHWVRKPWLQSFLPRWLRWNEWPYIVRLGVLGALSAAATVLGAPWVSLGPVASLLSVLGVAVGAKIMHGTAKTLGQEQTRAAIGANMLYQPGLGRRLADLAGLPQDYRALSLRTYADWDKMI